MKLSLAWIFDHINGSWKDCDVTQLVNAFNKTTAEIERIEHINIDLQHFSLARVTASNELSVTLYSEEINKELSLPARPTISVGDLYCIYHNGNDIRWAAAADWGSDKEALLPAFACKESDIAGAWKNSFESEDYLLHIENKSITHRPDLWGHRGIARECAALLKLSLIPERTLIDEHKIIKEGLFASATKQSPYTFEIPDIELCKRFSTLYIPEIAYRASSIFMAHRLVRVDGKPLHALVDATNYVMFDIGQPMHAFDAEKLVKGTIGPRLARYGEKITLLDGTSVSLTDEDLIIAHAQTPIALAGVMGDMKHSVQPSTTKLLLEAANFDADRVRKAAMRHKKRTEASTRFEKSLDAQQTVFALKRYLKLLSQAGVLASASNPIIDIGHEPQVYTLTIEHAFIESRLGVALESSTIIAILQRLAFVVHKKNKNNNVMYEIEVPTFRATKEAPLMEDIVEEIGRFIGYDTIPLMLPSVTMKPSVMKWLYREQNIKEYMAFGMQAREVMNYAFFDEEFLIALQWQPEHAVDIKNPVSQHWRRLVTSLIPHLIKNIYENKTADEPLRFFESNRIWTKEGDAVFEKKSIAGILFDHKKVVEFYEAKNLLTTLLRSCGLEVAWVKAEKKISAWFHPYQTAQLVYGDAVIGYAGKIDPMFMQAIVEGDAFIFELDAEWLLSVVPEKPVFKPLPKFPATWLDVSMFVPLDATVAQLSALIKNVDGRIFKVEVIDFFQKEEWLDKRSITMRFFARDNEKTLVKADIDHIYNHVLSILQQHGVTIR